MSRFLIIEPEKRNMLKEAWAITGKFFMAALMIAMVLLVILIIAGIGAEISKYVITEDAIHAGVGEWYVNDLNEKRWRWIVVEDTSGAEVVE
ncbi:MAG: hypothetical protein AAF432_00625 [Planctomycetota bacterium]